MTLLSEPLPPLVETMKKAATILREAGIPFALAGGGAAYARGAAPPVHDVDFVILEMDTEDAARAFDAAGMTVQRPPEGWLIKAFDGDLMIDLIFCLADEPVSWQLLDRAELMNVAAVQMPCYWPATSPSTAPWSKRRSSRRSSATSAYPWSRCSATTTTSATSKVRSPSC
jgi:hypothetical protein